MVGVKKYEDEQIRLILESRAKGHIPSEIVILCKQRWPRKEFKESGIKYVFQNYGKHPDFQNSNMPYQHAHGMPMSSQYGVPIPQPMQYANGSNFSGNGFNGNSFNGVHGIGVQSNPTVVNEFQGYGQAPAFMGQQMQPNRPTHGNQYGGMTHDVSQNRVASMSLSPQQGGWQMSSPSNGHEQLKQTLMLELDAKTTSNETGPKIKNNIGSQVVHGGQACFQSATFNSGAGNPHSATNSGFHRVNNVYGNYNAGISQDPGNTTATSKGQDELPPADPLLDPLLYARQQAKSAGIVNPNNASNVMSIAGFASGEPSGFQVPHQFPEINFINFNSGSTVDHHGFQDNQASMLQHPYQFPEPTTAAHENIGRVQGDSNARTQTPLQFEEPLAVTSSTAKPEIVYTGYPKHPFGSPKIVQEAQPANADAMTVLPENSFGVYPKLPFGRPETLLQPVVSKAGSHTVEPDKKSSDNSEFPFGQPKTAEAYLQAQGKAEKSGYKPQSAQSTSVKDKAPTQATPQGPQLAAPASGTKNTQPSTSVPTVLQFFSPIFEQPFVVPSVGSGWSCRDGTAEDVMIQVESPEQIPNLILTGSGATIQLFNPFFKGGFHFADLLQESQKTQPLYVPGDYGRLATSGPERIVDEESLFVQETDFSTNVGNGAFTMSNPGMSSGLQDLHFTELVQSTEVSPSAHMDSVFSNADFGSVEAGHNLFDSYYADSLLDFDYGADTIMSSIDAQNLAGASNSTPLSATYTVEVATTSVNTSQLTTATTATPKGTPSTPTSGPATNKRSSASFKESPSKRQAITPPNSGAVASGEKSARDEADDTITRLIQEFLDNDVADEAARIDRDNSYSRGF